MLYEYAAQSLFKGGMSIAACKQATSILRRVIVNRFLNALAAAATTLAVMLPVAQSNAAAFAAWQVANVSWGDTLNVRKYPSGNSQKQAAYPNGTVLQMTGRCTGGVNLLDVAGMPEWKQAQLVRFRWCEVWHDPAKNGNFVTGWVYGKYIRPH